EIVGERMTRGAGTNDDRALLVGGVDGVGNEVGEDLLDLSLKPEDGEAGVDLALDAQGLVLELEVVDVEDTVDDVADGEGEGTGVVAVEAEGLLGDVGDAGEFLVGGGEEFAGLVRDLGLVPGEVDEVHHG